MKARPVRQRWPIAALLCCLALPLAGAWAGEASVPDLRQLMEQDVSREERMQTTITSVGKRNQKLAETAAAVYVITPEDIRRSGATNIPDTLRMVPGLDVARIDSNKWAVSSRGFDNRFANKLLVLLDGREVYNPTFSGVYWEVQDVPLYDIERIEVIRGPGASLWGANAVNGVINIITKPAGDTLGGHLSAGGGTYEQGFGSFRYGHRFDENTAGRVWAQGFNRGSFDNINGQANHDDWGMSRAGFRLDRDTQNGNILTLEGGGYTGTLNQTLFLPSTTAAPTYQIYPRNAAAVSGFDLLGRWKNATSLTSEITLQAYFDHSYRNELFLTQERNTFDLDFQHRFLWGERHNLSWGLGYRVSQDQFGNTQYVAFRTTQASKQLFSAFFQDDITLLDNSLTLTLGSKLQHNDYTGFEIQPSIRLAFTPDTRNVLWGAISRAVRIPSRGETNSSIWGGRLPPMSTFNPTPYIAITTPRGNPSFSAEEVLAFELGYRLKLNTDISFDIAAFYNDYRKLRGIDYSSPDILFVTGAQPYWQVTGPFANSMNAQSYGVEWLSNWRLTSWWKNELAYTFIKTAFQSLNGPQNFSTENGYNPQQQVSLRSSFDVAEDVDLNLWFRYVDELPLNNLGKTAPPIHVPSYLALDARLAWRPHAGVELSVVGQNLLESRHLEFDQEALGPPRSFVPRSVYFKLDWRF